ncbi:hypothetical protein WJX84_002043 [Apatococcus fuscideae]|uniref:Uncharacterized protein n=1 Tax=Apatococcus fuscideae TaxID=2026836 RepID=A0AAW1SJF2_9CHLO
MVKVIECEEMVGEWWVFPIAMAESGSNFTTAADLHMMFDLSSYMSNSGSASTGNHAIIGSWFWATWPPNRPIVGGIQTDDADEIQWGKINYLAELGLTPWYTPASVHRLTPRTQPAANSRASANMTSCAAEVSLSGIGQGNVSGHATGQNVASLSLTLTNVPRLGQIQGVSDPKLAPDGLSLMWALTPQTSSDPLLPTWSLSRWSSLASVKASGPFMWQSMASTA